MFINNSYVWVPFFTLLSYTDAFEIFLESANLKAMISHDEISMSTENDK